MIALRWYGQSAFHLRGGDGASVFLDPFGDLAALTGGRMQFDYPAVADVSADLLLITHEHGDHNAAERVGGEPHVIRSTAGRFATPLGEVVAIASEHDAAAGTERGPNTIFVFTLDGHVCCHFGDFGQAALRPEQRAAIGDPEILFLPMGGGPTIGGEVAVAIVCELAPRVVVPMHYRTPLIGFLETPDEALALLGWPVERAQQNEVVLAGGGETRVVLPAPPAV